MPSMPFQSYLAIAHIGHQALSTGTYFTWNTRILGISRRVPRRKDWWESHLTTVTPNMPAEPAPFDAFELRVRCAQIGPLRLSAGCRIARGTQFKGVFRGSKGNGVRLGGPCVPVCLLETTSLARTGRRDSPPRRTPSEDRKAARSPACGLHTFVGIPERVLRTYTS